MVYPSTTPDPSQSSRLLQPVHVERTILRAIATSDGPDLRAPYFHKLDHRNPVLPKQAGTVILDLEDGVSSAQTALRRIAIQQVLAAPMAKGINVLVRCNGMDNIADMITDVQQTGCARLSGFILPMVQSADEVLAFDRLLLEREREIGLREGHFAIHLLIERPDAYLEIQDMVDASKRIASIMFGKEDFLASFPKGSDSAANLAEARIPLLAAAKKLPAIASPFLTVKNSKGFERYCRRMKGLGYSGVFSIHPAQRTIADDVFGISALELKTARDVVEASKESQLSNLNGKLIGPPMRKRAEALLDTAEARKKGKSLQGNSNPETAQSSTGRFPRYGIDTGTAQVGAILEGANVYTLDEGFRTKWFSHFPTSDVVLTSEPAARALGFDERPLPFSLLLNLCLCLSVDAFSRTCRYHLGLRDARQVAPVRLGDTVRAVIRVESMRNTSSGDAAVIVSTHMLVNQHDQPVFVLTKDSYYDAIPGLEGREALPREGKLNGAFDAALAMTKPLTKKTEASVEVDPSVLWMQEHLWDAPNTSAHIPASLPITEGETILHPAVRPIGWSENLELTTLVRNTHPIHFDAQRYGREGIVVCGGFVQAMMQGLASPEFSQVVGERLVHSFHTGTVMPEDRIGAVSKVLSIEDDGDHQLVTVSTLGLINVDVEQELSGVAIPDALFGPEPTKPSALRGLCAAQCPVLENRIALRAVRVLRRLKD